MSSSSSSNNNDSNPPRRRAPGDSDGNRTFRQRWNVKTTAASSADGPEHKILTLLAAQTHAHADGEPNYPDQEQAILEALLQYCNFTPDLHQSQLLNCRAPRVLLNCARQWGKSTVAALKAVHRALAHPNSLIVVISRAQRQSNELLRKILRYLPFDPREIQIQVVEKKNHRSRKRPRRRSVKATDLTLPNGSRIVALPGKEETIRCFTAVDLLLIDEASRVPTSVYHAVYPMLTHGNGGLGGHIWLMSTPNGKTGFFWEAWSGLLHSPHLDEPEGEEEEDSEPEWFRISVPATECPRYRKSFLREARHILGERSFAQEYLCQFTDADGALFREDLVRQAFVEDIKALRF